MSHHLRGDQQWSCECFTIAHWKLVTKPMLFRLGFFKASRTTIFTTLMRQTYFFVLHPIRLPDLPRSRTCTVLVASFKAESDLLWQQRWKYHIALKMSIVYQLIIKKKRKAWATSDILTSEKHKADFTFSNCDACITIPGSGNYRNTIS